MRRTRTKVLAGLLVLVSTVAVASAISSGGSGGGTVDVLGSLVGQTVVADSYRATTATGPAFYVDGILSCVLDLGPGARNCLGTNGSGDILLGPNDGGAGTEVRVGGSVSALNLNLTNGFLNLVNNAAITNPQPGKPVYVTEEEGLSINSTTPLKGRVAVAVTFDAAAISNNTCNPQAVTVTGAVVGDFAQVNANFALPTGVGIQGVRVTATDTVEVNFCNVTSGGSLDPASGSYLFLLER